MISEKKSLQYPTAGLSPLLDTGYFNQKGLPRDAKAELFYRKVELLNKKVGLLNQKVELFDRKVELLDREIEVKR